MKKILLSFSVLAILSLCVRPDCSAQSVKPLKINEDYSWNTPSVEQRELRYSPVGNGVEITDGTRRFNRALYGAHTGFRVECSDMPEFGLYLPRMGGNLKLNFPYEHCVARYEAGKMCYQLDNSLYVEAQVLRTEDLALWKIENRSDKSKQIEIAFGGVADKKFYREGDLGVDKPDCFDFKPEYCVGNIYTVDGRDVSVEYGSKERALLHLTLPTDKIDITEYPSLVAQLAVEPGETCYLAIYPDATKADCSANELPKRFAEAEAQRSELASALFIRTPDAFITPIGEALALAADGIWSGEAWLHGAVGWRTPYSGWRGAYVGDALGWHDKARKHFDTYAANQIKDIPPVYPHPRQDSTLNLARAEKLWGTQMYSDGYITRRPGKTDEMSHYDMNLCYIDELLRHLAWTGDKDYAKEIFPVLERHLAWEKRNYDPDNDHLYDAYCCIWASDALYYTAGAVTHSSAYNYYANRKVAEIAELIGLDPTPYREEADAILAAINSVLWMEDRGHWAEHRDFMGHKRLHPDAAVWTIYHAIDSEIADPFQAYTATRYVDLDIPHIPVEASNVDFEEELSVISTTNWKPYSWSINNVAIAEIMHTALAYWQAGRSEEAFRLMKGCALDNMYFGASPLNFGQISYYDAARGECYRDFGDPIGVWSRAVVEGLYGVRPDAMHGRMLLRPGFPASWNTAELSMKDLAYSFKRDGNNEFYNLEQRFGSPLNVRLEVIARGNVDRVTVNGKMAAWTLIEPSIENAVIAIDLGTEKVANVEIVWSPFSDVAFTGQEKTVGYTRFREVSSGALRWWKPEDMQRPESSVVAAGFDDIDTKRCEPVAIEHNASVSDIFNNRYLSPRPPYTTLQIPTQGIGEWCHPTQTAEIDDCGLRSLVGTDNIFKTSLGIPFITPKAGENIYYTSLWDNYPDCASFRLKGKATHAYLLMAGSTNHMQYGVANGEIRVYYKDGGVQTVELANPLTWVPIEQDIYYDEGAFRIGQGNVPPYRVHFKTGLVSRMLGNDLGIDGVYGRLIDCGAGLLLDIPLDPNRKLDRLELETLSNDVVIGLMSITLQRK